MGKVRGRQLLSLVLGLGILAGLAASVVGTTRSAAQAAAAQHLTDQERVIGSAALSIAPATSPEAATQLGQALAVLVQVTATSSTEALRTAMVKLAAMSPSGAAALYEPRTGRVVAASPLWGPALARTVRQQGFRRIAGGSMFASDVISTPSGAYTVQSLLVRGWGSGAARVLAVAGSLVGSQAASAAKVVPGGTILLLDSQGLVVSAQDPGLLGTRPRWWTPDLAAATRHDRSLRARVDGVDSQLLVAPVPGTSYELVMHDPVSEFYRATNHGSRRTELAIVLLAAVAGGVLTLSSYRQAVTSRRVQQQLRFDATHDHLTSLANRGQFFERVQQVLARHRRRGGQAAVLYLDLDGFKPVNDRHGHEAGDGVLREVGLRLLRCVREHDVLARLGGDEFGVLLDGAGAAEARVIADRIAEAMQEPIALAGSEQVVLGFSLGTAYAVDGDADVEELVRDADLAMYEVKRAQRAVGVPLARRPDDAAIGS